MGQRSQVLVNAVTVQAGPGTQVTGLPTNQDLASQNVPTGLLTRDNFRLARDSGSIPRCFLKLV
jgi:hypothetical protein